MAVFLSFFMFFSLFARYQLFLLSRFRPVFQTACPIIEIIIPFVGRMLKMKQRVTAPACGRLIQQFNQLLKQETFIKGAGIALSVLVGFLSAAAKLDIGGSIFAPFGIAFAAAAMSNVTVTRSHGYAPAAGAAIGYVLTAGTLSNM